MGQWGGALKTIKFTITDPSRTIRLFPEPLVICGDAALQPTIEMPLSGDSWRQSTACKAPSVPRRRTGLPETVHPAG
ncbi:MAG: hypothetical protein PHY31_09920 [Smithellaceae bacterium]|nr:hypothetical protein [Smithellaceae bacterium]